MKVDSRLLLIAQASFCAAQFKTESQHMFSNPPVSELSHTIPTPYESAVQGRRALALTPLGTLSTIFPRDDDSTGPGGLENRPAGMGGIPIGLPDYLADCEDSGNPTILAMNVATSFKNVRAGSNISLALQWVPPYLPSQRIESNVFGRLLGRARQEGSVPYSAANLPRFSLFGYLEGIEQQSTADLPDISSCFVRAHPDAKYWLPGNRIHQAEFVRLVVQQIYWVGGFGDRAYIGWISPDDWRNVTREEWAKIRLPGENKSWKEGGIWESADI